ncbi:MAG: stage III sporulation protein AB [Firmicutes bacterium]|nr:stage III sporulation protein AB [Bacillota bacterium]
MQFFLLGGIFMGFTLCGVYLWRAYLTRRRFFSDTITFMGYLGIEIAFSKNQIGLVIERYGAGFCEPFRNMITAYKQIMDSRADITRDGINEILWKRLRPDERVVVADLLYNLGRHACAQEEKKLRTKNVEIARLHERAIGEMRSRASIYLKLCIILGIGVVILLL